ncbi:MAG: hypothetical protein QMC83_00800 [Thermodesulfovibrionales bacterium]|nr:hypothetical protein [Thermodesulfovibrionales bacterium]
MIFSLHVIKELLQISVPQRRELERTYALIPATRCQRRTHCCSMLPEMTLVEALAAIQRLVNMDPHMRILLIKRTVSYFFLNPVEITSCPFLDNRDCLIYRDRFFGCRAYGLWSQEYYEKLTASNRQAKKYIQKQWENLGVFLPQAVIDFQVPYCLNVETESHALISDEMLLNISDTIEKLSEHFSQWHQSFRQMYFSDLSFLLASLVLGFTESVRMKFDVVSNIVNTGNRARLDRAIGELPDLFA